MGHTNTGGIEPVWSHSGRELFAPRNGQRQMVAVTIETRPTFSTGASAVLFSETGLLSPQYDVSPDDLRSSSSASRSAMLLVR